MVAADGAWLVKDLGSTNGTLLDGKPVRESPWQRGQTLRLGEVEIAFAPEDAAPPPEPPAEAILRMAPVNVPLPPRVPGVPALTTSPRIPVAAKPAVRRPQGFFAALPGAFAFPFRRNGLILLASGAVFFVILNFASRFVGIVGVVIGVFCSGYLFTFLKCIITTTALGDDEMPDWPEFEGIMVSGVWALSWKCWPSSSCAWRRSAYISCLPPFARSG
jgi:pSer/pThr/pTyr-binding forkhead associated (FHA) protein